MTDEKCLEVVDLYKEKMSLKFYDLPIYDHIREMLEKMPAFLEEGRREKFMRWLGFVQGTFWFVGVYTLDELKNHNRPMEESNDS